jgi:hypothetical protein
MNDWTEMKTGRILFGMRKLALFVFCYFCLAVPRQPCIAATVVPADPVADAVLIVQNQAGQLLTLSIDGGPALEVADTLTVDIPAGEHDIVLTDPCGDQLPRHEVMEAGESYTWSITSTPCVEHAL